MKRKVHYLCFAVDEYTEKLLTYFPSAQPKVRYMVDTLKELGYSINIVSSCAIKKRGFYRGRSTTIDENEIHKYFSTFKTSLKFLNRMSIALSFIQLVLYCLFAIKKTDKVIIYHSIYYIRPISFLRKFFGFEYILEVEELYSYIEKCSEKFQHKEIEFINSSCAYLLINDLIDEKITRGKKPAIISYGSYSVPRNMSFDSFPYTDKINIVYAGVIEKLRLAAFTAVETATHSNYRIHILGFGKSEDITLLKNRIDEVNTIFKEERVIFHGKKTGEEYYAFLQACDIALDCHAYGNEIQPSAADYSFPSKISTYLANGLRVVSTDIRCLKKSQFSKYLYFYSNDTANTAKSIADTIKSINLLDQYDSRSIMNELNIKFSMQLNELLNTYQNEV